MKKVVCLLLALVMLLGLVACASNTAPATEKTESTTTEETKTEETKTEEAAPAEETASTEETGGGFMNASLFPPEIADIISGIIIYLCAFSLLFKNLIVTLFTGKHKKRAAKAPDAEKPNGKEAQ